MKQMLIVLLVHLQTLVSGQQFTPVSFTLPAPPSMIGPLSPNYALYNAEKLHSSKIRGPTSFAFLHGNVYTVTADKRIVNIATCNPTTIATLAVTGCRSIAECGMLTSIRVDNNGKLVVLDAYKGLYRVDPLTGAIEQLYSSTVQVGGRTPKYLNDIVIKSDGTIFISDSSDKYDAANDMYIILEGRPSGRILLYSPDTKQTTEFIKDGIVYPNGLELAANETELLVSEMGRARLVRISLLPSTFRLLSLFSENLPGLPENIRRSSRNTFWVGISYVRHSGIPNSMDTYAGNPTARARTAYSVDQNTIKTYYPKYGLAIEVDSEGKPVGSLHDPTGSVFHSVNEAIENEGLLYVGSIYNRYTGRIVLPQGDNRMVTIDSVLQLDIVTAENVNSLVPSTYDTKEGTVVTLICYSKGYTIKGPSKVTCVNGKWLPEVPVCVSDSQTTDITTVSNSSTYMEDNSIILITLALVFAFVCVSLMVLVMFKLCSHKVRSLKTSPLYMSPTALKYPSYTGQYPHWINSKWWTNNSSWTYRSTDKLIRDIERSRKQNPNHSWRDFVSLSSQQQF